jgi:PEGA domain-containing protein
MNLSKTLTTVMVPVVLALAPLPVAAQHGGGGGGHGGSGGGHAGAAVGHASGGGTRSVGPAARAGVTVGRGAPVPRGSYRAGGPNYRGYGGFGYGYGRYGGFGYALGAPYYAFRPQFALGFGLFAGYPVDYPYWAFPDPYVYGYSYDGPYGWNYSGDYAAPAAGPDAVIAAPGSETAQPGQGPAQGQYGGLSFQITPATAQVYVDGVYVGTVGQFSATTQPLTLTPQRHHIELRADGYQAMTFDVDVAPGQVIPYQGTMQSR